jgi:putative restriction endonuclease
LSQDRAGSCKYKEMDELREVAVRTALFMHLDALLLGTEDDTLQWNQTGSFQFSGETFSIRQTRGRGINKPANLNAALSITTAFTPFGKQPPYNDLVGDDGYPRYKYEGLDPNAYTNRSLRLCMEYHLPLAYFLGVRRGIYKTIYPIFIIGEDMNRHEFTLGFSRSDIGRDTAVLTTPERRYVLQETRRRLHQPIFREQVLDAYATACAVCDLKHAQLLDAAHIIGDSKPNGEPVVPNGIALCKIHHAAYDKNLMGIRPDYRVVINSELLEEIDGPMLKHGLQEMNGRSMRLPRRILARPDKDRLEVRFAEFLSAS